MPKLAELLTQADQNLAESERLVAEQRLKVEEIKQRGEDAAFDEGVLQEMEASLNLMRQYRKALMEEASLAHLA